MLARILSQLYPSHDDIRELAKRTGLRVEMIPLAARLITYWHNTIEEAKNQGLQTVLLENAKLDYPNNPILQKAIDNSKIQDFNPDTNMIDWKGKSYQNLEKITGPESTLVPIDYLIKGLSVAKSVCKIVIPGLAVATGFVVREGLLVTNNHVIPNQSVCRDVEINFFDDWSGQKYEFTLDSDRFFFTNKGHDLTIVAIKDYDNETWGSLKIVPNISPSLGSRVNIIQYPGGGKKQLSYFHNKVAYSGPDLIQYYTDTLPGSSGSPVFDSKWNVVAIHHSGGWVKDPNTSQQVFRNQGTPVEVLAGLLPN